MSDKIFSFKRVKIQNSKGLSVVIGTILLIALTLVVVTVVWGIVNNIVQEETEGVSACFGNFGKVTLNDRFTCYNSSGNELEFSIDVGEIEVDSISVAISVNGSSANFQIDKGSTIQNLRMYNGSSTIFLPGENEGFTYIFDLGNAGFNGEPDSLRLAPVISEVQCEVSDTISDFASCSSLA